MKIDRLFNVLVLGGAAIAGTVACTVPREETPRKEEDPGLAATAASEGEEPAVTSSADAGATSVSTSTDASTSDGAVAACAKECVDLGLPCCWMGDCTSDPSCKAQLCD